VVSVRSSTPAFARQVDASACVLRAGRHAPQIRPAEAGVRTVPWHAASLRFTLDDDRGTTTPTQRGCRGQPGRAGADDKHVIGHHGSPLRIRSADPPAASNVAMRLRQ
jgi:hypothetical protein